MLIIAISCGWYLVKAVDFDHRILWTTKNLKTHLRNILCLFIPSSLFLSTVTFVFFEPHFLAFPRNRPLLWALVMILYPLLAAYPQELLFRAFFFQRYRMLFPNRNVAILFNALSFSLAHLFYNNWVAPTLSFLGGIIFAYRYLNTDSLPAAAMDHALWGNFLFTIGLGWYFYSGSIR
jgi:membrane protease YdiL (CAAX protease family)